MNPESDKSFSIMRMVSHEINVLLFAYGFQPASLIWITPASPIWVTSASPKKVTPSPPKKVLYRLFSGYNFAENLNHYY